MLRVSKVHRSTLHIDGEPCRFVFKKLSIDEFTAFNHEFERVGKKHHADQLDLRPRPGEEELTVDQIEAKRYYELTPEGRAEFDAKDRAEADRGNEFARQAIVAYVTAEPGQIVDDDNNREVLTGEQLVEHFGSRADVLRDLVGEIFLQNRLSEPDKKKLQLLRASMRSSPAAAAATGTTPEPTAASAANETSATSAAASEDLSAAPSGSTAP